MTAAAPPFLCAGAAHWDILGHTTHALPYGADVPGRITRRPGGVAQNVARALAARGHRAALVSAIGRDRDGDELAADLAAAGIDCVGLIRHGGPTDCYLGLEGPGGALHAAIADCTGLERVALSLLSPLRDGRLPAPWPGTLVLDGNLPSPVLAAFLIEPARALAIVPASPEKAAHLGAYLGARPATLYLNRLEAEALAGHSFPDSRRAAAALLTLGAAEAVVTDGLNPATAAGPAGTATVAPPKVRPSSTTGGGDVFVAAHLAARAGGLDGDAALAAALDAATRHISREILLGCVPINPRGRGSIAPIVLKNTDCSAV